VNRTAQELARMLDEAHRMPEGDARIALLEDLVRHADASGEPRLPFEARMELTSAYQHGGETGKAFVTFSWCLAAYDREPGKFTEDDDGLLRWQYKWTVAALKRFPEVPLDRSYRALDDMERRYLAGGHSMHAVHTLRCEIADHVGDLETGDEWYRKWNAAPRDENSDCVACDPTSRVYHLVLRGRDEEAVAIADPVLKGRITCAVQPHSIQSALLMPYLRTGRAVEARDAHRRAYRAIRNNRDYLDDLGRHLWFCAVTGNEAHGLEMLERHLSWLDRPADPMALLEASGSAALLLGRLVGQGHGGQRVRRPEFGDRPSSDPEVAELADELRTTAVRLAARFDERNQTDFQSRVLTEKLESQPVLDHLPLSRASRRRPARGEVSGGVTSDVAEGSGPVADSPELAQVDDLSPEGLLDFAEQSYGRGRGDLARAALRRFDEATIGPDSLPAVRRTEFYGSEQAESGDLAAAEQTWRTAADRYGVLGEEARRQAALGRVGMVCLRTDRGVEGMELIEASAAYLREHGTPRQRVKAQERQAIGFAGVGQPERAIEILDRLSADEATDGVIPSADLVLTRGMTLAALGPDRLAEALGHVARARDDYRADGNLRQYAVASLQHGRLLALLSEPAAAAEAFAEAAGHADHDPELRATALAMRGGLLARTQQAADEWPEQAVDDLVEAVALYTEHGMPEALYARFDLAVALANTGRLLDAAEAAEEALSGLERLSDVESAAGFRELLIRLYRGLGEREDALRQVDALVEYLGGVPDDNSNEDAAQARALGQAHETAGELLDELDRDAAAAQRFAAAADAYRQAGDHYGEVRGHRRRAMSLHWSGDTEAGLALTAETELLIGALPDTEPEQRMWERAALDYNRARMLAGVGRVDEAADRARAAADGFRQAGTPDEAKYADELVSQITGQSPG
jgi:tetratricopeptide (TPR) repeat protein